MRKAAYFGIIGAVFLFLFLWATAFDRSRASSSGAARGRECDEAVRSAEDRYTAALIPFAKGNSSLEDLITRHAAAAEASERRRKLFDEIISASSEVTGKQDASNQLVRRQLDSLAGALNRRDVALRECS